MVFADSNGRELTSDAIRNAVQELARGRWQRFRTDLRLYLERNADRILEPAHLKRCLRMARANDLPLADLCRARGSRLEYALYLAAFTRLCGDRTIRSRDEFDEQRREINQAIWTLGERLGRAPTAAEVRERLEAWVRDSAGPQREKMILIAQLMLRNDWPTYVQVLWSALERQLAAPAMPVPVLSAPAV